MAIAAVVNLVLSFGDRRLLDGANLTLADGEHVGLVGRNGCGKSTLLKLMAGLEQLKPDSGAVQIGRGAAVGYLTQDPDLDPQRTLRDEAARAMAQLSELHDELKHITHEMADAEGDALDRLLKRYEQTEQRIDTLGGFAVDHQIDATLHGVGLDEQTFAVRVGDLSGGQKGRLALAKLLLGQPDVLLLDEPTNHLDIAGRQWLEQFLAGYRGAVVLVSHDRWLLDRVATKIYELEDGKLVDYPGNYQQFRQLRAQRRLAQQRVYEKQRDRIRQEQAFIDRYRAGQRARQAKGREKRLERYKRDEMVDRPIEMDAIHIRMKPPTRCGDLVIHCEGLSKGYEGKPLFAGVSAVIKRGDRLGVIGPNGAGKTTLVNCMIGVMSADAGKARIGSGVDVGHYRQTHEHLNLSDTIVQYLQRRVPNGTDQEARDLAGAFMFSGGDQDKPLGVLSGGERSRVVLAGLVVAGHNLLILDEPTNHLDIPSAERLEESLRQFTAPPRGWGDNAADAGGGGTLILITHDRMLLDELVDQLLVLDGHGNARHFLGNYSEYIQTQKPAEPPAQAQAKPVAAQSAPRTTSRSAAAKAPRRSGSAHSKLSQSALEQRIMGIEAELGEVDRALADPQTYRNGGDVRGLQQRRAELAAELEPLEAEWVRRTES